MSKLLYHNPAKRWNQALPLGNGETAIMAFGGYSNERLCLNNANLWSGYPKSCNKDCTESLKLVREAVFDNRFKDAHSSASRLEGDYSQAYMPLSEINIKYSRANIDNYKRELDLDSATFNVVCGEMVRTAFVSNPDKVAVYRSQSTTKFDMSIKLSSKLKSNCFTRGDVIVICGNAPDYAAPNYLWTKIRPIRYNEGKAMAFAAALTVDTDGVASFGSGTLGVVGASYVNIYAVTHTGFLGYDKMPCTDRDLVATECINILDAVGKNYSNLLDRHIADYQSLYRKHSLALAKSDIDVPSMLKSVEDDGNPTALVNLMYDYGKYMTIAGSRNCQPLNLQGQWNNSKRPPWSSNLTANINFEMNYWGTAAVNLAPCLEPFFKAVGEIYQNGKETARINFNARGFACNHNVDIWRKTAPVKGNPAYMFAPLCGVWLANEVFTHKTTLGQVFDDETKQIITGAAMFCLDYLVEHNGQYVTCPSASPEAEFMYNGASCSLGYGSAFEMGLVKQCFSNCLTLDIDEALKQEIIAKSAKLYPFVETSTGINEWQGDLPITDKGHRHFSPLYGLYPGDIFLANDGQKEKALAEKLFNYRLSNAHSSIGWSGAWAICLAGRLHDKDRAENLIVGLLKKSVMLNLFGFHPPTYFQIDCNMGFVAGINELLICDSGSVVELLPACPSFMKEGAITGHVVRGSEVSFKWQDGKVVEISSDKQIVVADINIASNAKLSNVKLRGR